MKKVIKPFDLTNNIEYFFTIDNGNINFSKNIKDFLKIKRKLSPMITQIFDVYGSRVPYPFTVFEGIYRIDPRNKCEIYYEGDQVILKDDNAVNSIDDNWNIDDYELFLKQAFDNEREYAAVMLSSGWDSSSILATLCQNMPKHKIKTFTLQMNIGLDEPLNIFEIIKAKKLAEHFGVQNTIVHANYHKIDFEVDCKSSVEKMLFSPVAVNHQRLWDSIIKSGLDPKKTTVYAGEYSDGIHNFGFAQSFGAVYPDKGFRQYGDKINNYFLSPNFLERVIKEKNINEDFLVKNFAKKRVLDYFGWNEKDLIFDLIEKSFMEDTRGPFDQKSLTNPEIKAKSLKLFRDTISNFIEFDSLDQFYSVYLRTYQHFHWAGSTVKGIDLHNPGVFKVNFPFGNKEFRYLLEKMPTKYGRGLEPLPTKFPLKRYCEKCINNYPFDIQEGNHAYVYDVDQSISITKSVYNNSSYPKFLREYWNRDMYQIRNNFLNKNTFEKISQQINATNLNEIEESSIFTALSSYMIDKFLDYVEFSR